MATDGKLEKPRSGGRKPPLGRPKGVPNKTSALARENIMAVFTRLDGTAGMARWAKENPTAFYQLYAKLLPVQITGDSGSPLIVKMLNGDDTL